MFGAPKHFALASQHDPRPNPEETISSQLLAARDAFQKKAVSLVVGKLPVGADWRFDVREEVANERFGAISARSREKLLL